MDEERAREVLAHDLDYVTWNLGDDEACLDGWFSADELEAIAWWMRHVQEGL